jgi:hypothetical protein
MMLRILSLACGLFACFCGLALGQTQPPARDSLKAAISREFAAAKEHFGDKIGEGVTEKSLLTDEILVIAEVVVKATQKDGLVGSMATVDKEKGLIVSVTAIPLVNEDWESALRKFPDARFDETVAHYRAQAALAAQKKVAQATSHVHVYIGTGEKGVLKVAIGVSNEKSASRPRQFPDPSVFKGDVTLSSVRCDVDTEGELIKPGQGYLLTAKEVEKSQKYWNYLDPKTRVVMKQVIETDSSPWFVSEKHIGKFDVDKNLARIKAVEWWDKRRKEKEEGAK